MMTKIETALLQFQKENVSVQKTRANDFTKSKYSNIDDVWQSIRRPLEVCGLAIFQYPAVVDGSQALTTKIVHVESGESREDTLIISDMYGQKSGTAVGSALTYARRYMIVCALGIVDIEDDDAQGADKTAKLMTANQASLIDSLVKETGADKKGIEKHFQVERLSELNYKQAQNLLTQLRRKEGAKS